MGVTMCGARLVDKKAIEDLKESMTGCSMIPYDGDELGTTLSLSYGEAATSNDADKKAIEDLKDSMTGCNMIPYDGDELGTTLSLSYGEAATSNDTDKKAIEDLKDTMTGCSMIPYDGDELGTTLSLSCGEAATSNDVDVPHPKRIRLLNLNETASEEEESSETASCHESPWLINFFSL
ncbi:hypothetical protein FCV25MIE_03180 [Fagus crenata]